MKNFKNLIVWQRSMQLASEVNKVIAELPNSERFTYRDQIIRASISIPSNIAEGCSRNSRKDFKRFLQIALGSSFELETQFLLLEQNNIICSNLAQNIRIYNVEVQKMLQTLIKNDLLLASCNLNLIKV